MTSNAKPPKGLVKGRRNARKKLVQALYTFQLNELPVAEIEEYYMDESMANVDVPYFRESLKDILGNRGELNKLIEPHVSRGLEEIDAVEMGILWLAVFELKNRLDVPYRVVLNEAVELAKTFGTPDGHKFVNGVLDKLAPSLRAIEVGAEKRN